MNKAWSKCILESVITYETACNLIYLTSSKWRPLAAFPCVEIYHGCAVCPPRAAAVRLCRAVRGCAQRSRRGRISVHTSCGSCIRLRASARRFNNKPRVEWTTNVHSPISISLAARGGNRAMAVEVFFLWLILVKDTSGNKFSPALARWSALRIFFYNVTKVKKKGHFQGQDFLFNKRRMHKTF